ncbi:hypothetical protein DEI82_12995 [Curtobacterium sp. MCBD17_019]|nr:hypothetical protein DEI82_12995 [Curtobacterium sp. MCBD17_019]
MCSRAPRSRRRTTESPCAAPEVGWSPSGAALLGTGAPATVPLGPCPWSSSHAAVAPPPQDPPSSSTPRTLAQRPLETCGGDQARPMNTTGRSRAVPSPLRTMTPRRSWTRLGAALVAVPRVLVLCVVALCTVTLGAGPARAGSSCAGPPCAGAPRRPASNPSASMTASAWTWPVPERVVLRPFEPPAHDYGAGHRGIDVRASVGTLALAPAAGTVVFAGPVAGRGVVTIDHGRGVRSSLDSVTPDVVVGTTVVAGTPVGRVAVGHCPAAAPCVHLGVRVDERYVDPLAYLAPAAWPVLLPPGDHARG